MQTVLWGPFAAHLSLSFPVPPPARQLAGCPNRRAGMQYELSPRVGRMKS